MNKGSIANTVFLDELGLEPSNYANYEPLYLEALKVTWPDVYAAAGSSDPALAEFGQGYKELFEMYNVPDASE